MLSMSYSDLVYIIVYTVFTRIVSALDQYPPSNSVRTFCFCQLFSARP